jgi:hypothetical protein
VIVSFPGGADWKIASGLLSSAFCVGRCRAAVVSGGPAARIPVGGAVSCWAVLCPLTCGDHLGGG